MRYNPSAYILPAEKEEYALIAIREGRSTGCKAAREGKARKVALEGAGEREQPVSLRGRARYSAKRRPAIAGCK